MKINLAEGILRIRKNLPFVIMRLFLLLFCTSAFSFSSADLLSQNTTILFGSNKKLSVDQIFDHIIDQTDYTFLYQIGMFDDLPKVNVNKGTMETNELLEVILPKSEFKFTVGDHNVITIEAIEKDVVQQTTIEGTVTDKNGTPLLGVNVAVKGTRSGTTTDFDGKFNLIVALQNDVTLQFSFVGMLTKEVVVTNNEPLSIVMEESAEQMDEVVITGFVDKPKESFTGSAISVSGTDLQRVGSSNLLESLQAFVPGLLRVQNL